jgi:hypothetical protein
MRAVRRQLPAVMGGALNAVAKGGCNEDQVYGRKNKTRGESKWKSMKNREDNEERENGGNASGPGSGR